MTTNEGVPIVPVIVGGPRRRPVLAAGLGVAGAVAALTACQPTSAPPAPSYTYTPPPSVPATTTTTVPPTTTETTTEETTTTTTPPARSGGGGGVYGGSYTAPCVPTAIPRGYVCTCNCVPD